MIPISYYEILANSIFNLINHVEGVPGRPWLLEATVRLDAI